MTLKQVLLRYIKEKGHYGKLYNFLFIQSGRHREIVNRFIKTCDPISLFNAISGAARMYGFCWYYGDKSIYEFIGDWCVQKVAVTVGDIVSVKTTDGKYEFTYKVTEVWYSRLEIEVNFANSIKMERISKINGKECNFLNGWRFKKEIKA